MSSKKQIQELMQRAYDAQKIAHAKYSGFKVGAALETNNGEIYSGCNVESSSLGLTICAERVALTKALSEGKTKFTAISIVGPVNDYCPPCGACRQLLYDYAPDIDIIMTDGKKIKSVPLSELLPFAFEETRLRKK
jgi:cytidine deaminase